MEMRRRVRWVGLVLGLWMVSGALALLYDTPASHAQSGGWPEVQLIPRVGGLSSAVYLTSPPNESARLFIVEQGGRIRIAENGTLLPTPFLDIQSQVSGGSEQGLLSMAFAPAYATNGHFYINYTDLAGDTQIVRYTVSAGNPNVADPASAEPVLSIDQPYSNHNGGLIKFGPDGYLYIGMGDGGGGGDPDETAQDPQSLLGKMLRINVEVGDPATYTIPPDNPFVGNPAVRDEIWAFGVRNPWRFSFDRVTDDLYIADVGQNQWEEIDVQPANEGGMNWGWDCYEGNMPYEPQGCEEMSNYDFPVITYSHSSGRCSVTGGYVYRGNDSPTLWGHYFFSDFCTGELWAARKVGDAWQYALVEDAPGFVSSFGEDAAGRVYLVATSQVYELVGQSLPAAVFLPLISR